MHHAHALPSVRNKHVPRLLTTAFAQCSLHIAACAVSGPPRKMSVLQDGHVTRATVAPLLNRITWPCIHKLQTRTLLEASRAITTPPIHTCTTSNIVSKQPPLPLTSTTHAANMPTPAASLNQLYPCPTVSQQMLKGSQCACMSLCRPASCHTVQEGLQTKPHTCTPCTTRNMDSSSNVCNYVTDQVEFAG